MCRPVTTLYMLVSVDGKISTGATDEMDVDRALPQIPGLKEGLHQYYEIDQSTDLWSFNTGRVQAKIPESPMFYAPEAVSHRTKVSSCETGRKAICQYRRNRRFSAG